MTDPIDGWHPLLFRQCWHLGKFSSIRVPGKWHYIKHYLKISFCETCLRIIWLSRAWNELAYM